MATESEIARLLADIADGRDVDWAAVEAAIGPENARDVIDDLKLLSYIARLHAAPESSCDEDTHLPGPDVP